MELLQQLVDGNRRILARCISMVENELPGYRELLESVSIANDVTVIGVTGPPGAGKSTLVSALTRHLVDNGNKVAIIAVDPSSPFNHGALMGDRVRMGEHFLHPDVFIRSLASRGSLGGLAPKIYEISDIIKAAGFNYIIIETVGVGQSEVEIASIADTTILTLVPEAGDEIQTIKSGIMEIADIYVLNKSDREGADAFYKNLKTLSDTYERNGWHAPVIKTIATKGEGTADLYDAIISHRGRGITSDRKIYLLAEKAMVLIKNQRIRNLDFKKMVEVLTVESIDQNFNLYQFVKRYEM